MKDYKILYDNGDIEICYFKDENRILFIKDSTAWDYYLNDNEQTENCIKHIIQYMNNEQLNK